MLKRFLIYNRYKWCKKKLTGKPCYKVRCNYFYKCRHKYLFGSGLASFYEIKD